MNICLYKGYSIIKLYFDTLLMNIRDSGNLCSSSIGNRPYQTLVFTVFGLLSCCKLVRNDDKFVNLSDISTPFGKNQNFASISLFFGYVT